MLNYNRLFKPEKTLVKFLVGKGLEFTRGWLNASDYTLDCVAFNIPESRISTVGMVAIRHLTGAEEISQLAHTSPKSESTSAEKRDREKTFKMLAESVEACEKALHEVEKIQRRVSVLAAKYMTAESKS